MQAKKKPIKNTKKQNKPNKQNKYILNKQDHLRHSTMPSHFSCNDTSKIFQRSKLITDLSYIRNSLQKQNRHSQDLLNSLENASQSQNYENKVKKSLMENTKSCLLRTQSNASEQKNLSDENNGEMAVWRKMKGKPKKGLQKVERKRKSLHMLIQKQKDLIQSLNRTYIKLK